MLSSHHTVPVTWCHCVGGGEAHLTLTGYREAVITGDWCVATGLRALYTGAEVCGCSVPGSGSGSDQYQVVSVFSGCDRRHKTYNVTIHYQQTPDTAADGLTTPSLRLSCLY